MNECDNLGEIIELFGMRDAKNASIVCMSVMTDHIYYVYVQ